jgi:hypothetical protein
MDNHPDETIGSFFHGFMPAVLRPGQNGMDLFSIYFHERLEKGD